jgi:hypothetical protein
VHKLVDNMRPSIEAKSRSMYLAVIQYYWVIARLSVLGYFCRIEPIRMKSHEIVETTYVVSSATHGHCASAHMEVYDVAQ